MTKKVIRKFLPKKLKFFVNLPGKIDFFYPDPRSPDFKPDWRRWSVYHRKYIIRL